MSPRAHCPFSRRLPPARDRFDGEDRSILIDHLCRPCQPCWRVLLADATRRPKDSMGRCDDPFVRALRRISSPTVRHLAARHRRTLELAGDRPLGFSHLMLEEAHRLGREMPQRGIVALRLAVVLGSDPAIRAFKPPQSHGLMTHAAILLADLELERGGLTATREALDEANEHLELDPSRLDLLAELEVVRARWLEAQSLSCEARQAWRRAFGLLEAPCHAGRRNELLGEYRDALACRPLERLVGSSKPLRVS